MKLYTQSEVDELVREAKYKSHSHSFGCYLCGKQADGKDRHLVMFCDTHLHFCELIRAFLKMLKDQI